MERPFEITHRNVKFSPEVEAFVQEHAEKLDRVGARIHSFHIHLDQASARHVHPEYEVTVELGIPHKKIVTHRSGTGNLFSAIQEAFDVAKRSVRQEAERARRLSRRPAH